MKIYNLGSLNIDYVYTVDHFVAPGETLSSDRMQIFPGGKGLNQSIALARAGVEVIHGALVGDGGDFLLETMSSSGVDVSRIKKVSGSCGHAIIQVDQNGQNCILLFAGTNHELDRDYVESFLSDAQPGDLLLLQNEINCMDIIFGIAKEKGMQIALNPSPMNEKIKQLPLGDVKWWFCNGIEGEALFGASEPEQIGANCRRQYPDSNLILTLGEKGSYFISRDEMIYQPIFKTETVDTTAAGDTFTGYFICAVMHDEDHAAALKLAAKASAITVSRSGASESIPYQREL